MKVYLLLEIEGASASAGLIGCATLAAVHAVRASGFERVRIVRVHTDDPLERECPDCGALPHSGACGESGSPALATGSEPFEVAP